VYFVGEKIIKETCYLVNAMDAG